MRIYTEVYTETDGKARPTTPKDGQQGYAKLEGKSWMAVEYVDGYGWLASYDARLARQSRDKPQSS